MAHLIGSAAGRTGSVMFESTGDYDGTTATARVRPVVGSGTGDFAAVRGAGTTSAEPVRAVPTRSPITLPVRHPRRLVRSSRLRCESVRPSSCGPHCGSAAYVARQTRTIAEKIEILERGSDMVLAAHRTPLRRGLVATTVETVRFSRPDRVDFRLTRGPNPYVVEQFLITAGYTGELGTDLRALGARGQARPVR